MDLVYQPINTQDPMMLKNFPQDVFQVSTTCYFKNQTRIMYKTFQFTNIVQRENPKCNLKSKIVLKYENDLKNYEIKTITS